MATRGRIGIQLKNESILSIYSHWDNSPEHNGKILKEKYNNRQQVAELIDGGDISSLETETTWESTFTDDGYTNTRESQPLYYSERGDNGVEPELSKNLTQFFKLTKNCCGDYSYLFRNGEWVCYNMHQFDDSKLPEIVEIPSAALAV